MPFVDSPGWERDWCEHPWTWDFEVSTVSEGHRVVGDTDKSEAKTQGAKLTFGEVLDCGVSRMLYNLGASYKSKFHDLGMGPGKMLIQSYLQFYNLTCCMGVELARGRYELAENNVRTLLRVGWRGRKFLGIEFKKGQYFKIVELVNNQTPKNGWNIGDKVIAFHPLIRNKKEDIPNYNGIITDIIDKEKGLYKIEYEDKNIYNNIILSKSLERGIQLKYIFLPSSVRTLEIWYGSLFDYPDGFNAEICVLETDFPDEMHPELIRRMSKETPIGCTFLTYHNLKKFDCFDWDNLRQLDKNVFDNDRYITSWSQGWRFYTWQHCPNQKNSKPYTDIISKEEFTNGLFGIGENVILNKKNEESSKIYGVIEKIELDNGTVLDNNNNNSLDEEKSMDNSNMNESIKYLTLRTILIKDGSSNKDGIKEGTLIISKDEILSGEYILYKTIYRHKLGDIVCVHNPSLLFNKESSHRFDTVYARIIGLHVESLSYSIEYTDMNGISSNNQYNMNMPETYVFKKANLRFNIGDKVMACWPRNAQNKNCIHRYKRFPGEIIGINNDATYRIRYETNEYLLSLLRPELYPLDYDDNTKQNLNDAAPTIDRNIASVVREMWIVKPANFVLNQLNQLEQKIGTSLYSNNNNNNNNIDLVLNDCLNWNNLNVINYFDKLGLDINLKESLFKCGINGKQLYALSEIVNSSMQNNNNNNNEDVNDEKTFSQQTFQEYLKKIYSENGSSKENGGDVAPTSNETSNDDGKELEIFDNIKLSQVDFRVLLYNLLHIYNIFNRNNYDDDDDDDDDNNNNNNNGMFDTERLNRLRAQMAASGNGNPVDFQNFLARIGQGAASGTGGVGGDSNSSGGGLPGGLPGGPINNDPAAQQLYIQNLFKDLSQLQSNYPAAFDASQNTNQDTDRKED